MSTKLITCQPLDEGRPIGPLLAHLVREAKLWHVRAQQRRVLRELTSDQLEDIGISREAAWKEAAKPFWQA